MLISFEVGNHRSIAEPQQLSFAAGQARQLPEQVVDIDAPATPRLTRVQAVFGDNGSGKSNLLLALSTLQNLVLKSMSCTESEFAAFYAPFQSSPWLQQPTRFAIDVLIEGTRFSYSVAFNAHHVTFEQLLVYRAGRAQRWFHRERGTEGCEYWGTFSASLHGQREVWRQATRPRALYLSTAAHLNATDLTPLTLWFEEKLSVVRSADALFEPIEALLGEPKFKAAVLKVLQQTAPDILDFRLAWLEAGTRNPKLEPHFCYQRVDGLRTWMSGQRESAGRSMQLALTALIIDALNKQRCLCIDDFDAAIHPESARRLIRLITQNPAAGSDAMQLLFTSRAPALLDVESIRRDEMNLIERRPFQSSALRSFAEDAQLRQLTRPAEVYGRGNVPAAAEVFKPQTD